MKSLQLTLALFMLLFATVSITSCGEDVPEVELPFFEVKVDGADFDVSTFYGYQDSLGVNNLSMGILAGGDAIGSDQIILALFNLELGTYDFVHNTDALADIQFLRESTNEYTPISGQLVITSRDTSTKTIKGTFDGVVENSAGDQLTLTEGAFLVIYN